MSIIAAPWGALRGAKTGSGLAYLGIRYGAPPIGALRWKAPIAWRPEGLYDATAFEPSPPQTPSPAAPWRAALAPAAMSEDCLNLNVWTPAADGAKRPVLVHVFGGGFETGSASEGFQNGEALSAQGDVVVVRVNIRIGALGFLHLADAFGANFDAANRGALDLVLALRWVRENIAALGGDPDNVTLFGLSSGAFMIAALFAMPASSGLFAKAWMQSGSASRVLTRAQGADVTAEFLREAGVVSGDVSGLERLDMATILAAQRKAASLDLGDRNAPGGRTLGIVEDQTSLPQHPMRAIEQGCSRQIPIVLGYARDEARLWFSAGAMRRPAMFDDVREEIGRFAGTPDRADSLFAFYRSGWPEADPVALRERFLSDAVYTVPALRTARAHAAAGGRAFLYRFDWAPPEPFTALGASHSFDEAFVWNVVEEFRPAMQDPIAPALANEMSSALLNFAWRSSPGWSDYAQSSAANVYGGDANAWNDGLKLNAWEGVERR